MHPLQILLAKAGLKPRSYSGRGMYGKYCLSANIDRGGLGPFMGKALVASAQLSGDPAFDLDEVAEAFEGLSTDSMGLGMVVYFPGVPFEGDGEEDEDEENPDLELSDDDEDEG